VRRGGGWLRGGQWPHAHDPMAGTAVQDSARLSDWNEHTRWNFATMTTEAAVFQTGLVWVDPVAVLPLFIGRLSPSTLLVGLVTVLQRLGWILPQLPMAAVLGHRPRRAPFLRWGVFYGRLPFLAFAAYLWLYGVSSPGVVLLLTMVAYFSVALGNGVVAIPWQDIIAKSIPSGLRGRFFASIQFSAAMGGVGAGFAVRWMLGPAGPGFPLDFTMLFTLVAVFLSLSTLLCFVIREPIRPVLERPQSLREIVGEVRPLLRERPAFRGLILVALFGSGLSFTTPFYIVYATRQLGVPEQLSGIYIWAAVLGGATASLIWGHYNDRYGPLTVIRGGCTFIVITPLLAVGLPALVQAMGLLVAGARGALPYVFAVVFLAGGATPGAFWMGTTNYLFELANHQERPRYIALLNFLSLPGALSPLLIGWLLGFLPYVLVFVFIAACGAAATILSRRMPAWPGSKAATSLGERGR